MKSLPLLTVVRVTAVSLALTILIALTGAQGHPPDVQAVAAPPSDDFANAQTVTEGELPFSDSVDVSGATVEVGERFDCFLLDRTTRHGLTPSTNQARGAHTLDGSMPELLRNVYGNPGMSSSDELTLTPCGNSIDPRADAGITGRLRAGRPNPATSSGPAFNPLATGSILGAVTEERPAEAGERIDCSVLNRAAQRKSLPSTNRTRGGQTLDSSTLELLRNVYGNRNMSSFDQLAFMACARSIGLSAAAGSTGPTRAGRPYPATSGSLAFNLLETGSISGTVTEQGTGTSLSDICVEVYDTSFMWVGSGFTDFSGDYSVGGLSTDSYKVQFTDCGFGTHISEWYNDKLDFESADLVAVTAGSDTSAINAVLAVGGSISGTVTEEGTGTLLQDICVNVYDTSFMWVGSGYTDVSGDYSAGGLATGDYKVEFQDCGYPTATHLSEWYNDKTDFASADLVAVTAGSDTAPIDAALAVGGSISGTVTEVSDGPLADICVDVYDTSFMWVGSGFSDFSGYYTVGGLSTGSYKVEFDDCGYPAPTHISEWYNDKTDFASADLVAVTQGSDTTPIDAALAVGGSISGTVTEVSDGPLPDICVNVYDTSFMWVGSGFTDFSGDYSVGGLPTGDYKVEFFDCGYPAPTHISEWYNDKTDFDTADLVAVTQGSDTTPIDAALAVGGSISGTVTEVSDGPLADINVSVCTSTPFINCFWGSLTDVSGVYSVGGLPTGCFKVWFQDFAGTYISEWYNDKPDASSADLVCVTAGSDTPGIDAALAVGGSISGTVTEDATEAPLSDICVNVYDTSWNWVGFGYTDASGNYIAGAVDTGDYKVEFRDCSFAPTHVAEWYNDKADFFSADFVGVTQGSDTAGIDAALAVGGSISGTVTEEGTGDPLANVCVYVNSFSFFGFASTDSSGNYTVGGLRSGDYKVEFSDCFSSSATYISEWYDDKPDFFSADPVSVSAGSNTPGIDAALAVGGSISGTVTEEGTATLLADICVYVNETSFSFFGFASTDSSGNYTVGGLRSGDYKVEFSDCSFPGPATYISEWYNDKPDFNSADPVSVTQGVDTPGIDAALAVGGSISGTVTEEDTADPLADVCVDVYNTSGEWMGFGFTDSSGQYVVGALRSGDFKVLFRDCFFGPAIHISEWYNDKPDLFSADPVSVTQGVNTSGIDAALAIGGSISGTVTEEGTTDPLADVCVSVYNVSGEWISSGFTDSFGNYTAGGLRSGNYKVLFQDCFKGFGPAIHISEWYNDKPDFDSADPVSVTQGVDTAGIDAALAIGGSISGTVTDEGTSDPLANICVTVYDTAGDGIGFGITDSSGAYSVGALVSGNYKVLFQDCFFPGPATYAFEWYNDKLDFDSADPVSVTQGVNTSGIHAALAIGGSISGTVTDEATGDPLADICVTVYDSSFFWVGFAFTDSSGNYTAGGLPSGDYRVRFWDCFFGTYATYAFEWYNDKPDFASADPVSVTQGVNTSGINAALAVGGSISGTVTDEGTGDPLANICVTVYETAGDGIGFGITDSSGAYSVGGLATGDYKVQFWNCGVPLSPNLSEWYDDKPDFDSADLVAVTAGSDTSGIDAALALEFCIVTDCDSDGFSNTVEEFMGTDPLVACGAGAWPPDFNDDTRVNLADVFLFRSHFATIEGDPDYDRRFDLNGDGRINLADVFILRQYFATQCVP